MRLELYIFIDPAVLTARQRVRSVSPERPMPGSLTANGRDLVTESVAHDGRVRRITVNNNSVEKQIIKGSLSRVVTQGASLKGGLV